MVFYWIWIRIRIMIRIQSNFLYGSGSREIIRIRRIRICNTAALLTISGYRIPMLLCRDEVDERFLPQILTIIWLLEWCCGIGAKLFRLELGFLMLTIYIS